MEIYQRKFTEQVENLEEAGKWSHKVKTKHTPPEDLFATGSAEKIANWAKKEHSSLGKAISSLNFYINRAGSKLDPKQKRRVKNAIEMLQKENEK